MLRPFANPVACCWMLLRVVAQSLKPVKLFSQQLPIFLLFRDRRSVAQQCWIRLHSSSNIAGATHAHYAWFTKTCVLYPSHDALQVPTLLGVVASVCTPLPTRTQQLQTLLVQQCWELLRPFARSLSWKLQISAFLFFRKNSSFKELYWSLSLESILIRNVADSLISSLVVRRKSLRNRFSLLLYNVFSVSRKGAFYRIKTLIFLYTLRFPLLKEFVTS